MKFHPGHTFTYTATMFSQPRALSYIDTHFVCKIVVQFLYASKMLMLCLIHVIVTKIRIFYFMQFFPPIVRYFKSFTQYTYTQHTLQYEYTASFD